MTQEEKELLVKDLSARLPYGVRIHIHDSNVDDFDRKIVPEDISKFQFSLIVIKPYLRSMSSMTEEEYEDFIKVLKRSMVCRKCYDLHEQWIQSPSVEEWLNEHHFDYRGLIPMGLAIESSADMYPKQ